MKLLLDTCVWGGGADPTSPRVFLRAATPLPACGVGIVAYGLREPVAMDEDGRP